MSYITFVAQPSFVKGFLQQLQTHNTHTSHLLYFKLYLYYAFPDYAVPLRSVERLSAYCRGFNVLNFTLKQKLAPVAWSI